ncbi:MAG: hypothetical protein A3I78_09675 [Gammaproteobacteria bacterium RIFCSPLOWO2_02_FULL_56_15]|nr:MAG: hypothetical protein A3I78_09675 [Gammaproteobacteria bacterium RIFCSPLOWO2_02_FULL_56_15]
MRENISVDEDLDEEFMEDEEKELDLIEDDALAEKETRSLAARTRSAWRKIEQLREMRELNRVLQDDIYNFDADPDPDI